MLVNIKKHLAKYCLILIALLTFIIIYNQQSEKDLSYEYVMAFTDYYFGFVKRGLWGEIWKLIPMNVKYSYKILFYSSFLYITLCILNHFKDTLKNSNDMYNSLAIGLVLLSPFSIKNIISLHDLFYIGLLLCFIRMNFILASLLILLFPITLLIHEALSMLFYPAFLVFYFYHFQIFKHRFYIIGTSILCFIILSFIIILYGAPDVPHHVYHNHVISQLNDISIDKLENTRFLYFSYWDHLKFATFNPYSLFQIIFYFPITIFILWFHLPIIKSSLNVIYQKSQLYIVPIFLLISLIPILLLATDKMRFITDAIVMLIILAIGFNKYAFLDHMTTYLKSYSQHFLFVFIIINFCLPPAGVGEISTQIPFLPPIKAFISPEYHTNPGFPKVNGYTVNHATRWE